MLQRWAAKSYFREQLEEVSRSFVVSGNYSDGEVLMNAIRILVVSGLAVLAGCTSQPTVQTEPDPSTEKARTLSFAQAAKDREQFVVAEDKSMVLFFCEEPKVCRGPRDVQKYAGMKGYFKTDTPAKTTVSGFEFWPVALENGEEFYYFHMTKFGKYGAASSLIPLAEYKKVQSYQAEPLVPGSSITVNSVKMTYGMKSYSLSNGETIAGEQLKRLRGAYELSGKSDPAIAEKMLQFRYDYDEVEDRYFIKPTINIRNLDDEALFYIGINRTNVWLRMKIKYYGDDWLFVDSYKIAADSLRWQSPKLNFQRDHSGGNVWEWIDTAPTEEDIRNMEALSTAANPIIRFQGKQYYSDFKLSTKQQKDIRAVLALFRSLEQ